MPATRDPQTPRVSLGLDGIEEEGRIETERRARKLAGYLAGSTDPTVLQRVQKLDPLTLRRTAVLLAARLRAAMAKQAPAPVPSGTGSKPPMKRASGVKAASGASKTEPRALRQSSHWLRQRRTRPSYASRARRLGLLLAAASSVLAAAALNFFR